MNKYLLFLFLSVSQITIAQLRVDIYPTEEFMVRQMLIGDTSVQIRNVKFVGNHDARGVFYNKNTPLEIDEGIILSTGHAISAQGPNKGVGYTTSNRTKGDKDLHLLAHYKTYDATYISFDFTSNQNLIRFKYVFASEEYPEYVGSTFNDVFGFFLTDLETGEMTNLAVIPNTEIPITVNNINHRKHSDFYIRNEEGTSALLEYDGLTKTLIAYSEVIPGRQYRIKLAIADVADDAFDSSVFLKGKSFKSEPLHVFFETNKTYFSSFDVTNTVPQKTKPLKNKSAPSPKTETPPINEIDNEAHIDSIVVHFNFDKFIPTSQELNRLNNQIKQVNLTSFKISVIGYTDPVGSFYYNKNLSRKRANFISNYLSKNYVINPVKVEGQSFNNLVYSGRSNRKQIQNRRVVIYLN